MQPWIKETSQNPVLTRQSGDMSGINNSFVCENKISQTEEAGRIFSCSAKSMELNSMIRVLAGFC